ncbi:MAG: hypothetical protein A2161_00770 [Candidatus Schekmanbacteria bacterium RBG_13_48_7]|uniref:Uncharacterized protein n=1 Tax=Candidatus Schekmanbacteria bacterium RBG_13_48_7 TaxID=1817878 RepID=A0A1F7RUD8_9BACT|nr:MAG: hypothetical protein A2161_00770 [Candidatus Schekmanbacteria bacterium RBG_13_48_7]
MLQLLFTIAIAGILSTLSLQTIWHYLPIHRLDTAADCIFFHMILAKFRAIARCEDWGLVFYDETNSFIVTKFINNDPVDHAEKLGPFPLGKGIRYGGRIRTPSRPGATTFYKDKIIFTPQGYIRGISGAVYIADEWYKEGLKTKKNLRHRRRIVIRSMGAFINIQKSWK